MKSVIISTALIILVLVLQACKESTGSKELSYEEVLNEAWTLFEEEQYRDALERFKDAHNKSKNESEPYTGQGCVYFVFDEIDSSASMFSAGADKDNISDSHYALWGGVLNIKKQYILSNQQCSRALELNPDWYFPHGLDLTAYDLHLLKAINYFLIGDFESSLIEVQIINPSFTTDVTTQEGQIELAVQLEELKRK